MGHDFEKVNDREGNKDNEKYNLRHTTQDGTTIPTSEDINDRNMKTTELKELHQNDQFSSSDDDELIGWEPQSSRWIPNVPYLKPTQNK